MNTYIIIYLALMFLGLGMSIVKHGQQKEKSISSYLVAFIITIFLLVQGGFFTQIGWPQMVFLTLYTISFGIELASLEKQSYFNAGMSVISILIVLILLYTGGVLHF